MSITAAIIAFLAPIGFMKRDPQHLTGDRKIYWDAAQLIRERVWAQGYWDIGGSLCIGSAIVHAATGHGVDSAISAQNKKEDDKIRALFSQVVKRLGGRPGAKIWEWNDKPGRSQGEVISLLEDMALN